MASGESLFCRTVKNFSLRPSVATVKNRQRQTLRLLGVFFAWMVFSSPALAQRTGYLVRMLQTSDTFRVRVQAAISLGRLEASPEIIEGLSAGLRDDHPGVRTACASSLEHLGDAGALSALQAVRRDRDRGARRAIRSAIRVLERAARAAPPDVATPSANARFYVGVGEPGNQASVDRRTLQAATEFLRTQVQGLDGVELAPESESRAAAQRVLRRRRLAGFYVDSSIVRIEQANGGTRAVVSVIVNTYPGRDMRAILNGAATVRGASGPDATRTAVQAALRSAMRRLIQAMESSANR